MVFTRKRFLPFLSKKIWEYFVGQNVNGAHHLLSSIGLVKSIPKGTMGIHMLTIHPTFNSYQSFIIVTTSDPYPVIFGKSVLDLHLANIWIFVGRPLIGSQAGAASLVKGRPVLHHFKLWREATLTENFKAQKYGVDVVTLEKGACSVIQGCH